MAGKEPIYVWRYVLKSRAALNARSVRREFEGALIRIGDGFGCVHPWPELGDPELDELLEELRAGRVEDPLLRQAMAMARLDGYHRRSGSSLFEAAVPESHATVTEFTFEAVEEAVRNGFWIIKVKGHADFAAVAERLDELSRRWPALMWRIDFNGVLSKADTLAFVQCLTDHAWKRIDFLEDPCGHSYEDWQDIKDVTSLDLAMDYPANLLHPAAQVLVVKPARQEISQFFERSERLVVTSNMDHPLGQCFAAVQAANLAARNGQVDRCGLQTHGLFEKDEFSERLGQPGPRFHPPGGTGLGFDDLLEKLPWKLLK